MDLFQFQFSAPLSSVKKNSIILLVYVYICVFNMHVCETHIHTCEDIVS